MDLEPCDSAEQYKIVLRGPSGEMIDALVMINDEPDGAHLRLVYGEERISAVAEDVFDAFGLIRCTLWERQILPLCYGASRNVFPSPMSRSMGGGVKAYRLSLGKQAKMEDLVLIFDGGPDVEAVHPREQEELYRRWLDSLG